MIAKLRVGWIVAGWAFGVRTITRSVLFHCTTGLRGWAEESSTSRCSSLDAAPQALPASTERPTQRIANTLKIFDIRGLLSFAVYDGGGTRRQTNAPPTRYRHFPFLRCHLLCAQREPRASKSGRFNDSDQTSCRFIPRSRKEKRHGIFLRLDSLFVRALRTMQSIWVTPGSLYCWQLTKGETTTIEFVAQTEGKYSFRCCHTCGLGHRRMKGQIVVGSIGKRCGSERKFSVQFELRHEAPPRFVIIAVGLSPNLSTRRA